MWFSNYKYMYHKNVKIFLINACFKMNGHWYIRVHICKILLNLVE